jgi:hypothetical protein
MGFGKTGEGEGCGQAGRRINWRRLKLGEALGYFI